MSVDNPDAYTSCNTREESKSDTTVNGALF